MKWWDIEIEDHCYETSFKTKEICLKKSVIASLLPDVVLAEVVLDPPWQKHTSCGPVVKADLLQKQVSITIYLKLHR